MVLFELLPEPVEENVTVHEADSVSALLPLLLCECDDVTSVVGLSENDAVTITVALNEVLSEVDVVREGDTLLVAVEVDDTDAERIVDAVHEGDALDDSGNVFEGVNVTLFVKLLLKLFVGDADKELL